jgi:hypothetical protein
MPAKKPMMREGISTRPTDKYGNRATNADLGIGPGADAKRKAAAEKIMAREGTTSASGGRPDTKTPTKAAPTKMPSKVAPSKAPVAKSPVTKMPLKQQVTRTTTAYRPTPMGKKK